MLTRMTGRDWAVALEVFRAAARSIASVKVVEFAWVGEAAIGGQAALGGSRVGASSVGGISISAMASTCM